MLCSPTWQTPPGPVPCCQLSCWEGLVRAVLIPALSLVVPLSVATAPKLPFLGHWLHLVMEILEALLHWGLDGRASVQSIPFDHLGGCLYLKYRPL